jgi:hypothetical protein
MSPAQALRCDVVRPMSDNLGKPVGKGVVTEFDAELAKKVNGTSESTAWKKGKKQARNFALHY